MEKFIIKGQKKLNGTISVSGSKNAALPILAASLMTNSTVFLENLPALSDMQVMCEILCCLGCRITKDNHDILSISSQNINYYTVPYELTGRLRGSFLVLGPLLSRFGRAKIALPGGCPIGLRPIDLHIKGLSALGASFKNNRGSIVATAKELTGAKIYLDFPSVGATENILCAAVLAKGKTIIENAATEPEIVDLANFLCGMGAQICGAGSDTITIMGVTQLKGIHYSIMPDRIEAGTLLIAAAVTGGQVTVTGVAPDDVKPLIAKLHEMQIPLTTHKNSITINPRSTMRAVDIKTMPFPGFPTDMQAPMTAPLSLAEGTGMITETVFENRFLHAGELCRMGASIKVSGRNAVIEGKKSLTGTKVKATDLRAGAALVLAGLAARGDTEISDIYHIDRGYASLEKKLQSLGADIERFP